VLQAGDVAAFIVEPIQGEGGINVPPDGYLKEAERLCKRHGTLLILDEVQTGFGRTGRMFAAEHWDVEPDILTLAKSLSGGLIPIGAFVTTSEIWDQTYGRFDHYNVHTSTFGGNNLAAAAGLAAIQVLYEEGLIDRARTLGEYCSQQLKGLTQYKIVRQVRGKGLMLGVEFHDFLADIFEIAAVRKTLARFPEEFGRGLRKLSAEMLAQAVIIGELLNEYNIATQVTLHQSLTLRIQPPLIVTKDQIDYFIESLDRVCHRMDIMAEMCANLDSSTWSR
jgi:acetylornithine/succinyldiaminopimelate/putrescine aminotransferase